jgi:hypothetical protein
MDISAGYDIHTLLLGIAGTGVVGKIALMAVRTMPPPPATCGFLCRWFYDFAQSFGENPDKVGNTQDPKKPIGVELPIVSISKQQEGA